MNEVNVKEVELITNTMGLITKRIKPNFKTLGPRYGKQMKQIAALVASFSQERIAAIEASDSFFLEIDGRQLPVTREDFEITSEDMPGWLVATEGKLTVALDVTVTETLLREGIARELINRIQNIRKESGFEVTDKIRAEIGRCDLVGGRHGFRHLHRLADARSGIETSRYAGGRLRSRRGHRRASGHDSGYESHRLTAGTQRLLPDTRSRGGAPQ